MEDFLEQLLADSVSGHVVMRHELCSEKDRIAAAAMLARVCRESRRFAMVEVTGAEDERE